MSRYVDDVEMFGCGYEKMSRYVDDVEMFGCGYE